jgi:hypothetical protein
MQTSDEYQKFYASLEQHPQDRAAFDQLDLDALESLSGEERERAEELLLVKLPLDRDPRVVEALVLLRSQRAEPILRSELAQAPRGRYLVQVAAALWQLVRDPIGLTQLVGMASYPSELGLRHAAIREIGMMSPEASLAPLTTLLSDGHESVRRTASNALIKAHGLGEHVADYHDLLGVLTLGIGSSLRTVRTESTQALLGLLAQLRAGQSRQPLGLDRRIDRKSPWLVRLRDCNLGEASAREQPLDIAMLHGLNGFEREWVERILLSVLPEDLRALDALVALGSAHAQPVLAELGLNVNGPL